MSLCLLPDEVCTLTQRVKPSAQARELDHLGIPYERRRDGTLVVLRIHVETIETRREPELHL
jgi:hypothetical protein